MSAFADSQSATGCVQALSAIVGLREQIASAIARAGTDMSADTDLADSIDCLRSWLDDGEATLKDALRLAKAEAAAVDADEYERRIVPHAA